MSRRCRSRWTTGSNGIAMRFEPSVSTGARTVVVTGGVIRRGTGAGGRESYLADEVDATATGDRHPRSGNPCHPAAGCAPVTSKKIAEAGIEPAQASFRATYSYQQERLRSGSVTRWLSGGCAGNIMGTGDHVLPRMFRSFSFTQRHGGVLEEIDNRELPRCGRDANPRTKGSTVSSLNQHRTLHEKQSAWPDLNRRFRAPEARGVPGFPTR